MSTRYEYVNFNYVDSYQTDSTQIISQTFTPASNHHIDHIVLYGEMYIWIPGTSTAGIITVHIHAVDANHHPTGGILGSGTYDTALLPILTMQHFIITLGTGVNVVSGTEYSIEIAHSQVDSNASILLVYDSSNPYAGGICSLFSGGWNDFGNNYDLWFELWDGMPPHYLEGVTTNLSMRLAAPWYLTNNMVFTVPLCEITSVGLQPYFNLYFTVPVCDLTCRGIEGLHTHNLNHPIIKPEYFDTPKLVNRVYVVGVDADGNTVYGEAKDATINGEVLQIYPDSIINTKADTDTIAANILAKARLSAQRGQIQIPPALQMELWDVIKINDTICNQASSLYRVAGWQFTYQAFIPNVQEAQYTQLVKLTAV